MKNSNLFSQENITKAMLVLITTAIMFLFGMVFDVKHMVIVTDEAQQQNIRQWQKISKAEIEIAVNKNDIKWLKQFMGTKNEK